MREIPTREYLTIQLAEMRPEDYSTRECFESDRRRLQSEIEARTFDVHSSLGKAVWKFRELVRSYENPMLARGSCGVCTVEFLHYLCDIGYTRQVFPQSGPSYYWSPIGIAERVAGPYRSDWHEFARVGRIAIDWTYRQFDANCRFPHIFVMSAEQILQWKSRAEDYR